MKNNFKSDACTKLEYIAEGYELLYPNHVNSRLKDVENIRQVFGKWRPEKVLVVACGTGLEMTTIKNIGWDCQLYGFDLLPEMVEVTRCALGAQGSEATLWVGDLLHPGFDKDGLEGAFDLVIFRGNSLGHFRPDQYETIFANIYNVLVPEGRFIFDFRDGHEYYSIEPRVEQLGGGYLVDRKLFYNSFYCILPGKSIDEEYMVNGFTVLVDHEGKVIDTLISNMSGYNVLNEKVMAVMDKVGFGHATEVTDVVGQSLATLRSFVAEKV